MADDLDAEALHNPVEHRQFANRATVDLDAVGNLAEKIVFLRRHRSVQEAQRCLGILALDRCIFLISDAGAVIDNGEQHQRRRPCRSGSSQVGTFKCFRSDGLKPKCHSMFDRSA